MKINLIEIENFRSIKNLSIEPHNLCALVGPNSSGKTNILKAIDLVLGEGWTTKAKVARELFHNPEEEIKIRIHFENLINIPTRSMGNIAIQSIELSLSLIPELTAKTTINDGESFYQLETFKKLYHFVYIPSERNLSSELRVSNWTMLGKLMRLIYENYVAHYENDDERLKRDFKEQIKPAKDFLESDFSSTEVTFKKFSETFKKFCNQNSAGLSTGIEPILNIYNINWFYKTLQVNVKENDTDDQTFDSEEVGAGMKNILMLSIFQTYSELMGGKVIFGIEEPEIYLYPQAQRNLFHSFKELSENTQIFYTTHNPNFISAERVYETCLLRKDNTQGTYKLKQDQSILNEETGEREQYKIYTHFNTERNELFFANKVILVEGPSDKILFTTIINDKWEIDLDKKGISIIECNGKGGVIYFIGVCRLCGIKDFFAIWDQDDEEEISDIHNNLIYASNNSSGIEIPGNLEGFLNLPAGSTNKVKNAYKWAKDIDIEDIPELFLQVKEFIDRGLSTPTEEGENDDIDTNDLPF